MKYAIFRDISIDLERVRSEEQAKYLDDNDIRISEWVEIDFPPVDHEDVVTAEVKILEKTIEAVNADAQSKVNRLKTRISELLALPAPEES